ncbi:acyl-CoA dehydrogenase [Micromonospora humidisoli]|uniref:Acyl-CoA dehydrogenase family protein n=1 Tax=Micromonospora humidisoli TaxID=2807622 RepID=A0ABS2JIB7_9ACTN|nr:MULTISPECIES: acyl-CoA dehydrogenase family protein [Micromonospora]MBM7086282.1 acyl-CoA dehydrogenase family protein [Micromonospora humidisoli]GHJ07120.1 acyl-CoA dehydrogenase [Micromonospora sp. AKA109]
MTGSETESTAVRDAVRTIVPRLRDNGTQAEEQRWIPDENIALLEKAGVFRVGVPKRFGGIEASLAEQFAIVTEISRGCASTGWVAAAWMEGAWVASLYPDEVQADIYASGAVRISGGLAPTAMFTEVEDGFLLNGSWGFNTGCRGADWNFVAGVRELPDGEMEPLYALVPMDKFEIADDWHVSAAAGTGSFTTSATDVHVPRQYVASAEELVTGTTGGRSNVGATGRNYGLITYVAALSIAVYVGAAQGAYDTFVERLPGKPIAYTNWTDAREHPLVQLKVAAAANAITAAQALAAGFVKRLQQRADAGEHPSVEDSVTVRGQGGFALRLLKDAVEDLHDVSSASSLVRSLPFQRFYRDLEGLSRHGMMTPNTNLELHGRLLLGLDPDTLFL